MNESDNLVLLIPTIEYAERICLYKQEFIETGEKMDGTGNLRNIPDPLDWLRDNEIYMNPETIPKGHVQATQFIYVRKSDGKIVGMMNVRHSFTDYIEKYAGHIGGSICPSERNKGYATQMLRLGLEFCKSIGLTHVLLSCDAENDASRCSILANNGVYESTVFDPVRRIELERYWIDVDGRKE